MLRLANLCAALIYSSANGLLGFLRFFLSRPGRLSNTNAILLFRTGNMGDIVCGVPAFRALRKRFPESSIIFLTDSGRSLSNKQALVSAVNTGVFDEVLYYNALDLRNFSRILPLLRNIKARKIGLMVYLGQYDAGFCRLLRDMLFFSICGCRKLYGFKFSKHRFFKKSQRYCRVFVPEVERLMGILKPLGICSSEIDFTLATTDKDRRIVNDLWPAPEKVNGRRLVAIHPGAKLPVNLWPKENFLQLAVYLVEKESCFIVLIGQEDVRGVCEFLEINLGENCLNLCAKTDILQAAEVLSRSKLLVSCDSGPLHLAAAVGSRSVGIYTSRDYPGCWYPWGNRHRIIRHDTVCQVCLKTECSDMRCISSISPEEVISACKESLSDLEK